MRVRDFMSSPVVVCHTQDTLERAAQLLWERDCGILPVVDKEGHVGATITDRDICMGAYTRGARLSELRVADSMSDRLISCKPDDDLTIAVGLMAQHQLRRLVVLDKDGELAGLLSLSDLARAAQRDASVGREALKVLGAVCQRAPAPAAAAAEPVRRTAVATGQA